MDFEQRALMANWKICYNWMMDNEDRGRKCQIVPDPVTPHISPDMDEEEKQAEIDRAQNAKAISGINSYYFPEDFARIAAVPPEQRPPLVEDFYRVHFWNVWYDAMHSDEVSKRVLDASVNMGEHTAVRLLQEAINSSINPASPRIGEDGVWGPETVRTANSLLDGYLEMEFKRFRLNYYQDIVRAHPEKSKYLGTEQDPKTWWIRATK